MGTKVIPEQKLWFCDVCQVENAKRYRDEPAVIHQQNGLDFSGAAIADATVEYELCNSCNLKFTKLFDAFLKEQRPAKCTTCNDHGLIGGFVSADAGYESQPCPDCNGSGDMCAIFTCLTCDGSGNAPAGDE